VKEWNQCVIDYFGVDQSCDLLIPEADASQLMGDVVNEITLPLKEVDKLPDLRVKWSPKEKNLFRSRQDLQRSKEAVARYAFQSELRSTLEICRCIGTPRAMTVFYLLKENTPDSISQFLSLPKVVSPDTAFRVAVPLSEDRELVSHALRAWKQVAIDRFADDYLLTEMMSKNISLNSGIDKVAAAISSFRDSEIKNKETNARILRRYRSNDEFSDTIKRARYIIRKILGPLTLRKLAFAQSEFSFGPGATSAVSGADVLLSKKYASQMHVTPRLYPYVNSFIGYAWRAAPGADCFVLDSSRTTTVPKNAKTERTICIEPHLNIFCQKGVGALIRERLKRFGLDLNTQSVNQFMASQAQAWGLATIDLRSASNSVSHRLVRYLLPWKWVELLELCRTDKTVLEGSTYSLEMFSSMGNGYTFELETLIFYALALASGSQKVLTAVYGDDIIVEKGCADQLIKCLDELGFETNVKKTFLDGNFFESCGTDWFEGVDVRPLFFKGDYNDTTEVNLGICNALRVYAHRRGAYRSCDILFLQPWVSALRRCSDLERRTAIPYGYGDDGLIKNFDESAPSRRFCKKTFSWQGRVLPLMPVTSGRTSQLGAYVAALHRGATDAVKSKEAIRGQIRRRDRLTSRSVLSWTDMGPWC